MDGRTINNMRTVVVTMTILNLHTFGCQERTSVLPLGMYIGEESEIMGYVANLKKSIQGLMKNGIDIKRESKDATLFEDNKHFDVSIIWVSDLASLKYISNLRLDNHFCFECDSKRGRAMYHGQKRKFVHALLIPTENCVICIIHCDERVSEYLLKMMLIDKNLETKSILPALRKLPLFKNFSFTQKSGDLECEDQLAVLENSDYHFMLSGPQLKILFSNMTKVFGEVFKLSPNYKTAWGLWFKIRNYLYYTNKELETKNLDNLEQLISQWKQVLMILRGDSGCIGDYIHFIWYHLIPTLKKFGSLLPFSNQAVEASHQYDRFIMERSTANGKMKRNTKKKKSGQQKRYHVEEENDYDSEGDIEDVLDETNEYEDYEKNDSNSANEEDKGNSDNDEDNRGSDGVGDEGSENEVIIFHDEEDYAEYDDFNYETVIKDVKGIRWNDLYQILQIILKKLRILFLSFRRNDCTFKRMEERTGKVIRHHWTHDLITITKSTVALSSNPPLVAFRDEIVPLTAQESGISWRSTSVDSFMLDDRQ